MQVKDELLDIEGIKNSNKSLIDLFIRRTAVLTCTPEHITEKIIKDQWRRANQVASGKTSVSEIDFCNLGTFFMSKTKAKNKITKLERAIEAIHTNRIGAKSEQALMDRKTQMEEVIKNIKNKTKTNES